MVIILPPFAMPVGVRLSKTGVSAVELAVHCHDFACIVGSDGKVEGEEIVFFLLVQPRDMSMWDTGMKTRFGP